MNRILMGKLVHTHGLGGGLLTLGELLSKRKGYMTQDEIIEMAKLAGWEMDDSCVLEPEVIWYISQGQLEAFAKLVAEREREACAKEADKRLHDYTMLLSNPPQNGAAWSIASAIRARGNYRKGQTD
jgi:hypothetical protein